MLECDLINTNCSVSINMLSRTIRNQVTPQSQVEGTWQLKVTPLGYGVSTAHGSAPNFLDINECFHLLSKDHGAVLGRPYVCEA